MTVRVPDVTDQTGPYPGPRPLMYGEREMLVGRERDVADIAGALKSTTIRAVIVHALSGMGKSSLLMAGVVPPLTDEGQTVVVFRDWAELGQDPARGIVSAFVRAFRDAMARSEDSRHRLQPHYDSLEQILRNNAGPDCFFPALNYLQDNFGPQLVLVLDQLEEAFRLDRERGVRFVRSLTDLLSKQRFQKYRFKVVLSLRSEFRAELEPLERGMIHDQFDVVGLEPVVGVEQIRRITRLADAHTDAWRFDDEVAEQIVRSWTLAAFDRETPPPRSAVPRIGLLHLQAALWVLWNRTSQGALLMDRSDLLRGSVGRRLVEELVGESQNMEELPEPRAVRLCGPEPELADGGSVGDYWRDVYQGVLEEYLELSINRSRRLLIGEPHNDPTLLQAMAAETSAHLARIAPRLSSGGYKILALEDDLAHETGSSALPAEFLPYFTGMVRIAREKADSIFAEGLNEWEAARRLAESAEGLSPSPLATSTRAVAEEDMARLRLPNRQVAAGRLRAAGASLADLICEMAVTHQRSVQWLIDASVVRATPGLPDKNGNSTQFLSVIHDGYGAALKEWGRRTLNEVDSIRFPLVALRGESPLEPLPADSAGGDVTLANKQPSVIAGLTFRNLVWQGCDVSRSFKGVTFEDCDLRGTVFVECEFEDVTFRNCCLYGTLFIKSSFKGSITFSAESGHDIQEVDRERQIRGLSLEQECVFDESAVLSFDNLWGSLLSVTETACWNWSFNHCLLEHVVIQLEPIAREGLRADHDTLPAAGRITDSVMHSMTIGNTLLQAGTRPKNTRQVVTLDDGESGNALRHLLLGRPEVELVMSDPDRHDLDSGWRDVSEVKRDVRLPDPDPSR